MRCKGDNRVSRDGNGSILWVGLDADLQFAQITKERRICNAKKS